MRERWRPIQGYETLYRIGSRGTVFRLARITSDGRLLKGRELKPVTRSGYLYVVLCGSDGQKSKGVHQLVCEAFHGPASSEALEPNHKDGNKRNNSASNLEWMTRPNNQRHAADIGLKPHGERSHLSKLTIQQVRLIRELGKSGSISQQKIGEQFGISQTHVGRILRGTKWRNDI